jgi:hypothetical protein
MIPNGPPKAQPNNVPILSEVRYLGHTVFSGEVTTDLEKMVAMLDRPKLSDKHELRSFLGICTYYRQFISGFTNAVRLLSREISLSVVPRS